MTIAEIKEKLGFNSRIGKVKCKKCGKELEVPNMYGKHLAILTPYCPTATVLTVQWLIHRGWHITTLDANPSGAYFCPDCFPKNLPEYHRGEECDAWCEQAEKWMRETGQPLTN